MAKVLNFNEFQSRKINENLDFTGNTEPNYCISRICPSVGDVISYVSLSLRECGLDMLVDEYVGKVVKGDYNTLIMISIEYLNMCNNEKNPIVNGELDATNTIVDVADDIVDNVQDLVADFGEENNDDQLVMKDVNDLFTNDEEE